MPDNAHSSASFLATAVSMWGWDSFEGDVIVLKMGQRNLVVVAHPDDETLFFGGLIMSNPQHLWDVVCVTDANGGGRSQERWIEFENACNLLGCHPLKSFLYPDIFDKRLDVLKLKQDLFDLMEGYHAVYTHGPLGEYGHPHHQDVSFAAHEAALERGLKAWSVAFNSKADQTVLLDTRSYGVKLKVLVEIYGKETSKFLNFLNCSHGEGFAQVDVEEVRALYFYLSEGRSFDQQLLPHHGMLREWVRHRVYEASMKAFFGHYFSDG